MGFGDPREAALLRYLRTLVQRGSIPQHLHEEAREAGWTDEQLLEAIAVLGLESFTAMVNVAGEIPVDGSVRGDPGAPRRLTDDARGLPSQDAGRDARATEKAAAAAPTSTGPSSSSASAGRERSSAC